jgi:hypothetical protein
VLNFSPLSGNIDIFFSANPNRQDLYDTTGYSASNMEWYKSAPIPQAPVNPATGFVTAPVETEFIIELSMQELQIFLEPSNYPRRQPIQVGIKVQLDNTNGYVTMRSSDYLEFSGFIQTEIIFKDTE